MFEEEWDARRRRKEEVQAKKIRSSRNVSVAEWEINVALDGERGTGRPPLIPHTSLPDLSLELDVESEERREEGTGGMKKS
ncbi:hypothetical protein E2C01_066854 [Portunus trituberculatus]|uniref:Uncharacterized protein n=1 Tax=Portunus trituberculatus TaxID=210409 RepID=A0A5B7HMN2_PORTR|nr:hypothetical protein [Portunus trituberculatus]